MTIVENGYHEITDVDEALFLALTVVVAANCGVVLGVAGYELGALLYWMFIGLLTVTTMTTLYLAK